MVTLIRRVVRLITADDLSTNEVAIYGWADIASTIDLRRWKVGWIIRVICVCKCVCVPVLISTDLPHFPIIISPFIHVHIPHRSASFEPTKKVPKQKSCLIDSLWKKNYYIPTFCYFGSIYLFLVNGKPIYTRTIYTDEFFCNESMNLPFPWAKWT